MLRTGGFAVDKHFECLVSVNVTICGDYRGSTAQNDRYKIFMRLKRHISCLLGLARSSYLVGQNDDTPCYE